MPFKGEGELYINPITIISFCNYLKGHCSKEGVSLFSQVPSDRTQENSLKLHQGKFRVDIGKNFFMESVIEHWNRLPRGVMESLSPEVFKKGDDTMIQLFKTEMSCS